MSNPSSVFAFQNNLKSNHNEHDDILEESVEQSSEETLSENDDSSF